MLNPSKQRWVEHMPTGAGGGMGESKLGRRVRGKTASADTVEKGNQPEMDLKVWWSSVWGPSGAWKSVQGEIKHPLLQTRGLSKPQAAPLSTSAHAL